MHISKCMWYTSLISILNCKLTKEDLGIVLWCGECCTNRSRTSCSRNVRVTVYQDDLKIKNASYGPHSLSVCLFVCELIGCPGLRTPNACSVRRMLFLEHDFCSVNVQHQRWHGQRQSSTASSTSSLTVVSSSASPQVPRAPTHTQSIGHKHPTEQLHVSPSRHSPRHATVRRRAKAVSTLLYTFRCI